MSTQTMTEWRAGYLGTRHALMTNTLRWKVSVCGAAIRVAERYDRPDWPKCPTCVQRLSDANER